MRQETDGVLLESYLVCDWCSQTLRAVPLKHCSISDSAQWTKLLRSRQR